VIFTSPPKNGSLDTSQVESKKRDSSYVDVESVLFDSELDLSEISTAKVEIGKQSTISETKVQFDNLTRKNTDLNVQLSQMNDKVKTLQDEAKEAKSVNQTLRAKIDGLKKQFEPKSTAQSEDSNATSIAILKLVLDQHTRERQNTLNDYLNEYKEKISYQNEIEKIKRDHLAQVQKLTSDLDSLRSKEKTPQLELDLKNVLPNQLPNSKVEPRKQTIHGKENEV
jgi:chromosome segregation ATPase